MIRAIILVAVVAVVAVMFLPQTVATFPSVDDVIRTTASDIGNIRDGMLDTAQNAIRSMLSTVTDGVTKAVSDGITKVVG